MYLGSENRFLNGELSEDLGHRVVMSLCRERKTAFFNALRPFESQRFERLWLGRILKCSASSRVMEFW